MPTQEKITDQKQAPAAEGPWIVRSQPFPNEYPKDPELVMRNLPRAMMLQTDNCGVITNISPGLYKYLPGDREDSGAITLGDFIDDRDRESVLGLISALSREQPEVQNLHRGMLEGGERWIARTDLALFDQAGERTGTLSTMTDVTDLLIQDERVDKLLDLVPSLEKKLKVMPELMALVLHTIKNHVHLLLGITDIISKNQLKPEDYQEVIADAIERISKISKRLEGLVDWFDNIAEGRNGPERTTLNDFAGEILSEYSGHAKDHQIDLQVDIGDMGAEVIDARQLDIFLDNFIDNALKFTPETGKIIVRARTEGDRVIVQVEDTGMGMDENAVCDLMDPHRMSVVKEGLHKKEKGQGLGMRITLYLATLIGGHIDVQSTPGKGSIFTLTLPRFIRI
jgi:signal transduction histidine kinase